MRFATFLSLPLLVAAVALVTVVALAVDAHPQSARAQSSCDEDSDDYDVVLCDPDLEGTGDPDDAGDAGQAPEEDDDLGEEEDEEFYEEGEEDDDVGDDEVEAPVKRSSAVSVRLELTKGRGRTLVAVGRVASRSARRVRLVVYRAGPDGRWDRVASRTARVRRGRFRARLVRYRAGKWKVDAVVAGRGGGRASRSRGLSSSAARRAGAPAALAEARFFETPAPGPLPGGGYWSLGSRDAEVVREVLRSLRAAGFPSDDRGVYGGETVEAVRRFQRAHGLLVDGIVGRQTRSALREYG